MADYREHYLAIQKAGASVAAVAVDGPEKSEALRVQLSLPFPILCDTERRVVRQWGVYNSREKGGIAKPAVFIVDPNHVILYAAADTVARRVPATEVVSLLQEVVSLLQNDVRAQPHRRKVHVPLLSDWIRAIRNSRQR